MINTLFPQPFRFWDWHLFVALLLLQTFSVLDDELNMDIFKALVLKMIPTLNLFSSLALLFAAKGSPTNLWGLHKQLDLFLASDSDFIIVIHCSTRVQEQNYVAAGQCSTD